MRTFLLITMVALALGCEATSPGESTSTNEQALVPASTCVVCCRAATDGGTGRDFGQCMRQAAQGTGPCAGCRGGGGEEDAGEVDADATAVAPIPEL